MRLRSTPKLLATERDWLAYLDSETMGCIYYFNGITGKSLWELPTDTFPEVNASAASAAAAIESSTSPLDGVAMMVPPRVVAWRGVRHHKNPRILT